MTLVHVQACLPRSPENSRRKTCSSRCPGRDSRALPPASSKAAVTGLLGAERVIVSGEGSVVGFFGISTTYVCFRGMASVIQTHAIDR